MIEATFWGLVGASSLLLGAIFASVPSIHRWLVARHEWRLGLLMAFGAGVLVSAVTYDLFEEAVALADVGPEVAIGLAIGALAFFAGDVLIARFARPRSGGVPSAGAGTDDGEGDEDGGSPMAILLGTVLDGIPESVVIGISLIGGGSVSVAVLAAVFLSNIPEAIVSTGGLARRFGLGRTMAGWSVVVVACGLAAGLGYALLDEAPSGLVAGMQAFAAGAILVMLTDEMIPGAHRKGHTAAGLATAFGFAVAALLSFST